VTPLFVALIAIELTDVAFAIDSVPAALSITRDRFVVYSSNAFAMLGLRSLYLAAHIYLNRLRLLHYGLAAVLAFAAVKLVWGEAVDLSPLVSILIIVLFIGLAAVASLVSDRRGARRGSEPAESRS
jgi:tellurite resistance protein TerC